MALVSDEFFGVQQGARRRGGEWKRALALFLVLVAVSPVPSTVLVGIPFVSLMLVLPARRLAGLLFAAFVAFLVTSGSGASDGLWYIERGWAVLLGGWFVAATIRWPRRSLTSRALAAVAGAGVTAMAWFATWPGAWGVVEFSVGQRLSGSVGTTLEALRLLQGEEALAPSLVGAVIATSEWQFALFPGLIGLGSLAALALAWWMYVRAGLGREGALGALGEFRFNDHFVWLFIAGLLLVASGVGGAWSRMGSNAVLFMGGLYVLRGVAVVWFVQGGLGVLGAVLAALALVFLSPVLIVGAMLIGLGDTWLDVRSRVARST